MIFGLLLSGAARAAAVLALGIGVYALLARAAAATRRFVLVVTLGMAIVVPVAAAIGPRWTVEAPVVFSGFARETDGAAPRGEGATEASDSTPSLEAHVAARAAGGKISVTGAIALGWFAIGGALLLRAGGSLLRARALAHRAKRVEGGAWIEAAKRIEGGAGVEVRASLELDSPAVTGLFRATIVIPQAALDWPVDRCRVVLLHELAHVRRRDVLAQTLADVACAVHWCNPLVWICARRLRVEREIAADDAVLAAGVLPSRYAEELVAVATSVGPPHAVLAMAERSSLEGRVMSILAASLARAPLGARGTAAIAIAGMGLAAAAACTSARVSAPQPGTSATPVLSAARIGTANDPTLQRAAEDEIAAIAAEWSPEAATVLVLDPATGEILANAGRSGGQPADVAAMATTPGSTLKPILFAAALETHAVTLDQKFPWGPAPRTYGDKTLEDAHSEHASEPAPLAHILAVSSNIGASHVFDALGGDNLGAWLRRFHFGAAPGVVPARIESGTFEGAVVAIGEGLTATPLQMIAAYGAFANEGVYHAPTVDRGGSAGERLLSAETAHSVMTLLEAVVTDPAGTGTAARVEGVHVVGKTGTADWTPADGRERTYASFVGIADLPARRIVVLVGIEALPRDGLNGRDAAAPAFGRMVRRVKRG